MPAWTVFLALLLALVGMVAFGAMVRSRMIKGRSDGLVLDIASTPRTFAYLIRHSFLGDGFRPYVDGKYEPLPAGLSRSAGQPVDPGFVLVTTYNEAAHRPVVQLIRLSDGKIVHEYRPAIGAINAQSHFSSPLIDLRRDRSVGRNLMMHPLLMPDGGLIIHDSSPLSRVDACGRVEWVLDGIYHHAVESAADGSIYALYRYPKPVLPDVAPTFDDEAIAHVTADGTLLGLDRVADILDRNGLGTLWRNRPYLDDPFHLNDVQPALTSGPYWQKGDLFVSLRNLSMIMLYRPSTGRVLWHRIGPWSMQHDIAILDDHRISVFDNNMRFAAPEGRVDGVNRIPVYDFRTDSVGYPFAQGMQRNAIVTPAQGRQLPMANGDVVVEETEGGRLMRMAPDGTIRWRYVSADAKMRRFQLRWSRYLDPKTDGAAIQAAVNARCN